MKISSMYRPEIDGLRAVAVLAVILFHAGVPGFGGGYVGVDVFFVISGYLITSLIVAEREAGTFSLLRFYERRARRILPALFFVLIVVSLLSWMLIPQYVMLGVYQSVLGALGMFSNILFWREVGYWDPMADLKPLLHTWSLAVEEQFYLLYPLAFQLLWRRLRGGIRKIVTVIVAGVAASLGLLLWAQVDHPNAAFYLLPTRVWELLAGAAVACLLPNHKRAWLSSEWHLKWRWMGATAGMVLTVLAIGIFGNLLYDNTIRMLAAVTGTVLVVAFAVPSTWAGRLLGSRPLVGIGLISYSAYLIHWPVFFAVRVWQPDAPSLTEMLAASAAVLLMAWASWRFIEQPFRRPSIVGRRMFFIWMGICIVVIGGIGAAGRFTNLPTDLYRATSTENHRRVYDNTFALKLSERDLKCSFEFLELLPNPLADYEKCVKRYGKAIVVLGDSHAKNLYDGLIQISPNLFIVFMSLNPCDASQHSCAYEDAIQFIRARKETVRAVVSLRTGRRFMRGDGNELLPDSVLNDPKLRNAWWHKTLPIHAMPALGRINAHLRQMASISGLPQGPVVYVVGPYVLPYLMVQPLLRYAVACDLDRAAVHPDAVRNFEKLDAEFVRQVTKLPTLRYVSTFRHYFEDKKTYLYSCDASFWFDAHHLTQAGSRRLVEWLLPSIPELSE